MELALNDFSRIFYLDESEVVSDSGKRYELLDVIGAGGNGLVLECIDSSGTEYAIKFLLSLSTKSLARFMREVNLLKALSHPHIIKYIDNGTTDAYTMKNHRVMGHYQIPFIIMERADSNLVDYIKANSSIGYEIYAAQFRGLCEALEELHKYAIHRDIKPENILIKGETWVLSDFGLCSYLDGDDQDLTRTNEKVGPALWMSPEAVNRFYFGEDEIGTYSDVFQLCAVFAFALTKRHPGGIIAENSDLNTTKPIRELIISSLSNEIGGRPANGHELTERFNDATINAI